MKALFHHCPNCLLQDKVQELVSLSEKMICTECLHQYYHTEGVFEANGGNFLQVGGVHVLMNVNKEEGRLPGNLVVDFTNTEMRSELSVFQVKNLTEISAFLGTILEDC